MVGWDRSEHTLGWQRRVSQRWWLSSSQPGITANTPEAIPLTCTNENHPDSNKPERFTGHSGFDPPWELKCLHRVNAL